MKKILKFYTNILINLLCLINIFIYHFFNEIIFIPILNTILYYFILIKFFYLYFFFKKKLSNFRFLLNYLLDLD